MNVFEALQAANDGTLLEGDEYGVRTGRGPQGNLRNFKQMSDKKFWAVVEDVLTENNDAEAMEAVLAEADRRQS